jgi:eukaryotic-like serine/threonine-protein kinase
LSAILIFTLIIISIWLSLNFAIYQQVITAQTDELNFVLSSNPTFGITTEYPADWGRLDLSFLLNNSADIDFYPLDDTSGSKRVWIRVETIPSAQNMTFEQYSNAKINSTKGQILESNSTALAGLPAREIVFTNVGLKTMQVRTLKDNRVFTITYIAEEEDFEGDLQVAHRMIESFRIIK